MRILFVLVFACLLSACTSEETPAPEAGGEGAVPEAPAEAVPAPEADAAQYVGTTYPPYPPGVEERAGATLLTTDRPVEAPEYGYAEVVRGGTRMLWLSRLEGRDDAGTPTWEVVDAVAVPPLEAGEHFLIYGCRKADWGNVAAIVGSGEEEVLRDVRRAWLANLQTEDVEEIPPTGVTCDNPDFRN